MTYKSAAQLVADANQRVEQLTPIEVATEYDRGDSLLVDIREPAERDQIGTIAGSIHAPRGMIEFYADPTSAYHREEFDPNRRVILFCASGGRSALAADSLRQLGYTRIAHLSGGLKAWQAAGQPVAQTAT